MDALGARGESPRDGEFIEVLDVVFEDFALVMIVGFSFSVLVVSIGVGMVDMMSLCDQEKWIGDGGG